ncbi:hypothetical protein DX908_11330 [Parvularcula marina]|uniref:OmpA-like domain-containing protein n=2 Tax=Parvularcula marina TaxID=2292771 RepID=A0A371RK30_9PROT|nr:hypothetical protein DX908_11330 [Parvularcula marina]
MMKFKLALLAAAGSTAMFSSAIAQEDTGWYGALGAGYVFENEVDFESANSNPAFDSTIDASDNVAVYGALGKYLSNGWRTELEFATRTQNVDSIDGDGLGFAGFPTTASDLGDITVSTLMVNAYKEFAFDMNGKISPYLGAGIGAAYFRPDFNNITSPTAADAGGPQFSNRLVVADRDYVPAAQGMAGLTYDFADNMMLDLRYRYLKTAEVDYGGYMNSAFADFSSEYDAHEVTAGFRWNFGGAPVVVDTPPAVQYKTCFDGSRVEVTADCPPQIETTTDVTANMEPLVVYFDYDKSNLTDAARTLIAARADEAIAADVAGVNVEGNTDSSGSSAYNQALSARRAGVVRDALVSNGIDSSIITVEALGESNPAKPTADGVREPLNRRTEVTFSY